MAASPSKRKRSADAVAANGDVSSDNEGTATATAASQPAVPAKKPRGRNAKSGGIPWTEEQDAYVVTLCAKQGDKRNWKDIVDQFVARFPGANKTPKAIKCRYDQVLKGSNVELDQSQKRLFQKAVYEIDNHRVRWEAYAWRFGVLAKMDISKSGAQKLFKEMKTWNLDDDGGGGGGKDDARSKGKTNWKKADENGNGGQVVMNGRNNADDGGESDGNDGGWPWNET